MNTDRRGVVEVRDVSKRFSSVLATDGVSFSLDPGTFFALLGPSGCGKTTLLRMIAGFEQPDSGSILIGEEPMNGVPPYRRPANTVFQQYALFPHMDVAANVGYALSQQRPRLPADEIRSRVDEAIELVRLAGYRDRRIWELSGGQQQRVALARALVSRPQVLLLDEPLSALDAKLRAEMRTELKVLQREVGITFVFVTHDQVEAMSMADRVAVMRDGRILQDADPEAIYDSPVDTFVADFVGNMNLFRGRLGAGTGRTVAVECEDGLRLVGPAPRSSLESGSQVALAVRPERLGMRGRREDEFGSVSGAEGTRLSGKVVHRTFLGDHLLYRVMIDGAGTVDVVTTRAVPTANETFAVGDQVSIEWPTEAARVISDVGRATNGTDGGFAPRKGGTDK